MVKGFRYWITESQSTKHLYSTCSIAKFVNIWHRICLPSSKTAKIALIKQLEHKNKSMLDSLLLGAMTARCQHPKKMAYLPKSGISGTGSRQLLLFKESKDYRD